MSKQDKVAPRTAADLERRYGKSFTEILGVATDARDYADEAKKKAEAIEFQIGNSLSASFKLSIKEDGTETFSLIEGKATKIHFNSDSIAIESTNFTLKEDGEVTIKKGSIGNCSFDGEGNLIVPTEFLSGTIGANQINADGIVATNVDLTGKINATEGSFGDTHITPSGSLYGNLAYSGFYMGSTMHDTFMGVCNKNGYRALLGLGMAGSEYALLTNKEVQYGSGTTMGSFTWKDIAEAIIKVKAI